MLGPLAAGARRVRDLWPRLPEPFSIEPEGAADEDALPVVLEHVSKRLGKREALHDLSLTVRPSELLALVGPSGCGKTTTVRLMCNLYWPTSGMVRVLGYDYRRWPPGLRERIGYMPQSFALYPRLTVEENLRYVASLYGLSPQERAGRIAALLDLMDLADARAALAANLSGGMRRRVALISALLHAPDLIFVDEPTAGLDPALRVRLWEHFRALREQGRSLVVTTQYIDEADYCDRVAVLRAGHLLALGTPEALRRQAFGGDVLEVRSGDLTARSARALDRLPMVREVEQLGLDSLRVVVEEARSAIPLVIAELAQHKVTVESISERRPSFDEVFLRLTGGSLPLAHVPVSEEPEEEGGHAGV
ncbi:MAG TPA: ABC transporter ATP-binding protein [Ktedonobacterales bacterium]|jgi:ABC-2 type transport system ATP-binding protein